MLSFVRVKLTAGVQDIVALVPDTVNVIDGLAEPTPAVPTGLVLDKLLESVLHQLFVFHVKVLVLLHVSLVLEGELAPGPVAVEVGRLLTPKGAVTGSTVLDSPKSK